MDIIVFSDNKNIIGCFTALKKVSSITLAVHPVKSLKKAVAAAARAIVYLDVSGLTAAERSRSIKTLSAMRDNRFAIIDPKGAVDDVGELFFAGAADYVGKKLYAQGITLKRIQRLMAFRPIDLPGEAPEAAAPCLFDAPLSGADWSTVRDDCEYTFCFMFIELDHLMEQKERIGAHHVDKLSAQFMAHIEKKMEPLHGRLWMPQEYGGVILFPFDGARCDAILTCFRMVMDRHIMMTEDLGLDTLLSFRIVLHVGSTVYRGRGSTGTIVSDTINSIFHLGKKFAEPGNFYLTPTAARYIPEWLIDYFLHAGEFEGREITRMRVNR